VTPEATVAAAGRHLRELASVLWRRRIGRLVVHTASYTSSLQAKNLATSDRPTTAVVWDGLALAALAFGLLCIRACTARMTSWMLLRTHLIAGKQAG
jgi:hypothetical protein